MFILLVGKQSFRKVKHPVPGHTPSEWQSLRANLGTSESKVILVTLLCCCVAYTGQRNQWEGRRKNSQEDFSDLLPFVFI